jgi:hypothetical protein
VQLLRFYNNVATSQLVAAAKSASARNAETEIEEGIASGINRKIKEMELQTLILKLEKELEQSRKRLFDLRKDQYREDTQM